jgi:hypothetical protein
VSTPPQATSASNSAATGSAWVVRESLVTRYIIAERSSLQCEVRIRAEILSPHYDRCRHSTTGARFIRKARTADASSHSWQRHSRIISNVGGDPGRAVAVILGAGARNDAPRRATMIDIVAVRKRRQLDIETQSYLDGARWLRNM